MRRTIRLRQGCGGLAIVSGLFRQMRRTRESHPLNLYAYRPESDPVSLAASYAFGLVRNHAFVDGDKRTGFLACGLFSELNGLRLIAGQTDAASAVLALADGTIDAAHLEAWLREHVSEVSR